MGNLITFYICESRGCEAFCFVLDINSIIDRGDYAGAVADKKTPHGGKTVRSFFI